MHELGLKEFHNSLFIRLLIVGIFVAVQDRVYLSTLAHSSEVGGQQHANRGHVKVSGILADLSTSSNRTSEASQRSGSFLRVFCLGSWNDHMLLSESGLVVILPGHVQIPVELGALGVAYVKRIAPFA